jgi:hypothetical protein
MPPFAGVRDLFGAEVVDIKRDGGKQRRSIAALPRSIV